MHYPLRGLEFSFLFLELRKCQEQAVTRIDEERSNFGEVIMAKTEEAHAEPVDRTDMPCVMCGSADWCDCEWDTFVPSEFVATRPTHKVVSDESPLIGIEEANSK